MSCGSKGVSETFIEKKGLKNLHYLLLQILSAEFKSQGYNVPTYVAPNFLMWFVSWFDKTIASIVPTLGQVG